MKYLSFIGYGNELMLVNQWDGVTNLQCSNKTIPCLPSGFITGQAILTELEMSKSDFGLDIGILFAMYFIFRFITYLVLLVRVYWFK